MLRLVRDRLYQATQQFDFFGSDLMVVHVRFYSVITRFPALFEGYTSPEFPAENKTANNEGSQFMLFIVFLAFKKYLINR